VYHAFDVIFIYIIIIIIMHACLNNALQSATKVPVGGGGACCCWTDHATSRRPTRKELQQWIKLTEDNLRGFTENRHTV